MKYIRKFEQHKSEQFYYYNIGKKSTKSIFEQGLILEGYSRFQIYQISKDLNFKKVDKVIIETLLESFKTGEMVFEEVKFLNKVWSVTKNAWSGGIKFLGGVYNNFSEFIKNIGTVISNIFKKVGEAFKALWQLIKTSSTSLISSVSSWIIKNQKESIVSALAETISNDTFVKETSEIVKDLGEVQSRFQKGNLGNTSDEAKKKLELEAPEYSGANDLDEVEELIKDSLNSDLAFKKIYYCLKGYLLEGNSISLLLEADEDEYKVGDKVKYKSNTGDEVEKEIVKIEGDKYYFLDKEGNQFFKSKMDIVSKVEGESKVKGRMGVMGFTVECFKVILNPIQYLVGQALKSGLNGSLILISALARKGFDKAYKYKAYGKVIKEVNKIVEGEVVEGEVVEVEDTLDEAKQLGKGKKITEIFSDISKVLVPVLGSVLVSCLETQIGPVITILRYVLLAISSVELIKVLCSRGLVKGGVCGIANFKLN